MMVGEVHQSGPAAGAEEEALWRRAKSEGSASAREALFFLYIPFARRIASRHFRDRRTGDIEYQDLQQLACTGLLEAIDRFVPARGVPFRAYASHRIAGVIVDGVSKMSELREQIAFRNRLASDRVRSLSERSADGEGAADSLKALADLAVGLALGFMLESAGLVVVDGRSDERPNAYESLAWRETANTLMSDVDDLPQRERTIIRSHYMDGVSFEQLADLFGLSKGRISQLHRTAIGRLRKRWDRADAFTLRR